ncbi:hypothetical protein ACFY40_29370 [Streptomyces sp. NPDC012950]|uniref:hypothetical protein n=1 Tax=Streptomyces sp. NPDC012950 TaxID=3364858 RepID=UPI0036BF1101
MAAFIRLRALDPEHEHWRCGIEAASLPPGLAVLVRLRGDGRLGDVQRQLQRVRGGRTGQRNAVADAGGGGVGHGVRAALMKTGAGRLEEHACTGGGGVARLA